MAYRADTLGEPFSFLVRVDLELCEAEELREAELQRKYSHAAVDADPAGANRGKELSDHTEHCTSGGPEWIATTKLNLF